MNQTWLDPIIQKERQSHFNFFGKEFDLSDFQQTLIKYGEKKIEEWRALLLEPHFLPEIKMDRKAEFPGFKVRPGNHCYEVVHQGRVLRQIDGQLQSDKRADCLLGQSVLIDTRLKPAHQQGQQMWLEDNLLGPIIERLREEGKIPTYQYGHQTSRFGVSDLDFDQQIKNVLAEQLSVPVFRLERAVEGVVIPQIYGDMPRKDDGDTNTWVWYEEFFGDRACRLDGGDSDYGGLAVVHRDYSGTRWANRSFRPLAVL